MKIINHRLHNDDDTPMPFRSTPNQGGPLQPLYLVMHYTAGPSAEHSINWLTNPSAQASAHIVIGRDGAITQLVPFNIVAWHAGRSNWNGLSGLNQYSIGIELDNAGPLMRSGEQWIAWYGQVYPNDQVILAAHKSNPGVEKGWHLYTPEQLYTALDLSALLVQYYGLRDVLGHEDIAPMRKTDPGPAFPMDAFRGRLFGRNDTKEAETIYETVNMLNIRSGPGSQYPLLDSGPLPKGTRLQLLEESGSWRQVAVKDVVNGIADIEGWVHGGYIKPINT